MTRRSKTADGAPQPVDLYVGARLRELRHQRGLSQQAFGEMIGVSFQQIQKYERGANRLSASALFASAKALTVPVAHFFAGLDESGAVGAKFESRGLLYAAGAGRDAVDRLARMPADLRRAFERVIESAAFEGSERL